MKVLMRVPGWFMYPGAWAVHVYRVAHWLWRHHRPFVAVIVSAFGRVITGVEIHPKADIGRRFSVMHGVGVVISSDARIGDDCVVHQGVTIGGGASREGVPTLGNRVVVGANAVLLGPINIGDDAKIGAGAVVLQTVPPRYSAVGNPARILPPKSERA